VHDKFKPDSRRFCRSAGVHHDQLWGDINLVNGQPWPFLDISASWQRFRILNADISRPRILMVSSLDRSTTFAHDLWRIQLLPFCPCVPRSCCWNRHDLVSCYCAQIRDDNGAEISSKICNIIGSDGGSMPYARDHKWPSTGMMTDVAYRWDVVCDFSAYTGRVR
jgi:FtsP/CotA-like multicopper oxidase with cupredoxin domain